MAKNGTLHSKGSPLMQTDTVKDPSLFATVNIDRGWTTNFIREVSIRYRCGKCGRFVNPGFEEVFKEHEHCGP